jgi:hypothetical protein
VIPIASQQLLRTTIFHTLRNPSAFENALDDFADDR